MTANCAAVANGSSVDMFAHLIRTLLAAQCALNVAYPPDRSREIIADPSGQFDFVIVGSGSAGSVVANRLSETESWRVLLIEAGEDPSLLSEVPGGFAMQLLTPEAYSHSVEPEEHACHGMRNKVCRWTSGKALGGTSTLNAMLYIHGNDEDYNGWSRMGNVGWSWDEVLPYFKKSHNCGDESRGEHCGRDGPVNVRPYNYTNQRIYDMFLDAARELNVPVLDALNSGRYVGYGTAHGTLDKGRRMSVSKAYLSPIKDRKNLYVMKSSRADTVLLDGTRAVGVRVTLKDGRTVDVRASKEVILSAGSVGTPRILLLSGIGPEQHLREFGIPSVADLPVGRNLQDHVMWYGLYLGFERNDSTPIFPMDEIYRYLIHGRGFLASCTGHDFMGFVNVHDPASDYPNIQFQHSHVQQRHTEFVRLGLATHHVDDAIIEEISKILTAEDMIMTFPILLNPKSRGEVQLRSDDPADPVRIRANYYSERQDLDTMLKSLDFLKKVLNTEAMKRHGVRLRHLDLPGCRHTQPDTDEYWRCNLRHLSSTIFHPAGTAKMGPRSDPTAVVDPRLRVHGVQRLRVIDASVMPRIISGNTNAPAIMIGEKGADLVKEDWTLTGRVADEL